MSVSRVKTRFTIGVIAALVAGLFTTVPAQAIPPQIAISNVVRTVDGFTFQIANYDPQYAYTISGPASGTELDNLTGWVTVSGLGPGETATAFIQAWGDGQGVANNVTSQALEAANNPTFSQPVPTADGFRVNVTNHNPSWAYSATVDGGGSVTIEEDSIVVSGMAPNSIATVTLMTNRQGYATGNAQVTGTSAAAVNVPAPIFSSPVSTANGFTFRIINQPSNGDPVMYPVAAAPGVTASANSAGLITVSGMNPGTTFSLNVFFRVIVNGVRYSSAESTVTGSSLPPLSAPLYPSAFAQSATSAFVTWGSVDGATSYRVTASNGGGTCTNTINYCTISGLTAGQNYTFEIVALRDGVAGPAAQTAGVLMASALDVGGSLSSSTWKVGAVVTATPLIVGQYSVLRYEWYRCSAAVPVSEAVPACEVIAGADGAAYTLKAADLGKYVTAHLRVTGGVGQVTATIANSRPVLAANAAGGALVDPDGKPLIAEIPTRQISVVGGTIITINGTGFTGVTSVLVNGAAATVISATDTTLIISVPASSQVGLVDVAVTTPKGTATEASALAYVAKQATISSKSKVLTAFTGSTTKLSSKQKSEIKAFVKANASLPKLVCSASTVGVKKSTAETKAALSRARAACSYAASLSANIFVASKGSQGKTTGSVKKLVALTLSN